VIGREDDFDLSTNHKLVNIIGYQAYQLISVIATLVLSLCVSVKQFPKTTHSQMKMFPWLALYNPGGLLLNLASSSRHNATISLVRATSQTLAAGAYTRSHFRST